MGTKILHKTPKDWRTADLADVADIIMGQSPASTSYNQSGEGLPFFQGKADFTKSYRTMVRYWTSAPTKLAEPGDVLLSVRAPVGDVALNGIKACVGRGLAAIRAKNGVSDQSYIFQLLLSLKDVLNVKAQGSTFTAINGPALKKISVIVPPLSEQKKIAEILTSVDEEIQKTNEIIAATEKLKRGLMRQLFTKGIGHAKFKKTKIGDIPSEWEIGTVGELCELGRGRVINKKELQDNPGPYPVYSSQTSNNGEFGRIATYDFDGEYVTWTTDGEYAGATFYRHGKFNCTNVCGTLKPKVPLNMRYLSFVLEIYAKNYVVKTANPKLMNGVMATVVIPVPTISEQKKIAEIILSCDEKIAINKQLKEKLVSLKKGLMQDLLTGKKRTI